MLPVCLTSCSDDDDLQEGEMRDISAVELVRDMGLGVNIGNTFDSLNTNGIAGETGWGNPLITRDFIKSLAKHGFKTVRLPVSWADYIGKGPEYAIDDIWMDRVAEVVGWILAEDMYCVLNLHHDGGGEADGNEKYWIKKISISGREKEITERFTKVWTQIAKRFANASDKLILEGMNEVGFDNLWNRYSNSGNRTEAYRLVNKLNQTFVDAVRAADTGNNANRFLLVAGYWTDIDNTCRSDFVMPQDTPEDRLILSLHYYTPWNFCGGKNPTWGSASEVNELNRLFDKVKNSFLTEGVPVILGEYGVNLNNGSRSEGRINWMTAVTQKCIDLGICPVLWDTGMRDNNKQGMADLQRTSPFAISGDLKATLERLKF
jgi:endoglucanase